MEEHLIKILKTSKERIIIYKEKKFYNPKLFKNLNFLLGNSNIIANQKKVNALLDFALNFNDEQIKNITNNFTDNQIKNMKFKDNGFIFLDEEVIGNFFIYESNEVNFEHETYEKLNKLANQINSLKFKEFPLIGGFSLKPTIYKNGKVYKKVSNNSVEYIYLRFLNKKKFRYAPIYYGKQNNFDVFSYIKGKSSNIVKKEKLEKTSQLVLALKEMNMLTKNFDNKVFVHNDLSQYNVLFDNQGVLTGIIDWDSAKIGEEYEDFIYILWTWLNIGQIKNRNDLEILNDMKFLLYLYNPDSYFKKDFIKKINKVMDDRLRNSENKENYKRTKSWVDYSKEFIKKYEKEIEQFSK